MSSRVARSKNVKLCYAANIKTERKGVAEQHLHFLVQVENLAYAKQVDIVWVGVDRVWRILPATFHSLSNQSLEYWVASVELTADDATPLPRNIHFAVRYRVEGKEYWDNNQGQDYFAPQGAAVECRAAAEVLNIGYNERLLEGQTALPVTIAMNAPSGASRVTVHWTDDNWQHTHLTPCELQASLVLEQDEAILEDGAQIWGAELEIGAAFRVQYCFCYETEEDVLWSNGFRRDYVASRKPLNVLVLNLHCLQEENQDYKFSQIAKAIDELCVDVVCLQEVAENWNDGKGDWPSNTVRIINERLREPFHIHTDWSHMGFDRYREGIAILSRYPFTQLDSRTLSKSRDPYSISTRKGILGQVSVPYFGSINFFCVHVSWWSDGFEHQLRNLLGWAEEHRSPKVDATLLCGDFNNKAGSVGYGLIVDSQAYDDEFLAVNSPQIFKQVFHERQPNWQQKLEQDGRIDYVFRARSSNLCAITARFIFSPQEYGPVSDHEGLFMSFEPV